MDKINQYGDSLVKTTGLHGPDISSQRIDDLDRKALEYVLEKHVMDLKGADIGCGLGIQGIRFALLNANITLIDILDIEERIRKLAENLFISERIRYLKKDVKELSQADLPFLFDFIYTQRFIHYLNYREANKFIALVASVLKSGGRLFISASGIHSELGIEYDKRNVAIEERYFSLSSSNALKHNIYEKVCLYSEKELTILLLNHQFDIESIWTSAFGNIKATAIKK